MRFKGCDPADHENYWSKMLFLVPASLHSRFAGAVKADAMLT
jgi:hypothetical protein